MSSPRYPPTLRRSTRCDQDKKMAAALSVAAARILTRCRLGLDALRIGRELPALEDDVAVEIRRRALGAVLCVVLAVRSDGIGGPARRRPVLEIEVPSIDQRHDLDVGWLQVV